jgi:hypothetical protein
MEKSSRLDPDIGHLYIAPIAGALSGISSWSLILPIDTIKTRIQTSPQSMSIRSTLQQMRAEGSLVRGLYRGFGVAVLRAIPSNGVGWFGTELAMYMLMSYNDGTAKVLK